MALQTTDLDEDLSPGINSASGRDVGISWTPIEETLDNGSAPPTYKNKITGFPPSYSSIFGQIQEAKEGSSGNVDFAKKTLEIASCGGMANIISIFIFWVLNLACIAVGAAYLHMCPASPMIPKYLIVAGTFYTLKVLIAILKIFRLRCEENPQDQEMPIYVKAIDGVLDCFLLIWFIVGNVYIYGLHGKYQWTNALAGDFCNRDLYLFAFWWLTIHYIILLLLLCCGCVLLGVFCFCMLKNKDNFAA